MGSKVVIAGGTGLVGTALCAALAREGHEVVLLVRKARPEVLGLPTRNWTEIDQALEGSDAIVNLAGEPIAESRWTPRRKRVLMESRTLTTRRIVEAIGRTGGPKVLVNASAVGYYGHRSKAPVDETSAGGEGFLAELCQAWEAEADTAEALGIRVVKLRLGMVLAREGGALPRLARMIRWGLGTKLGSGFQGVSWIHIEDLAEILAKAALDGDFHGIYNAVAPDPLSNEAFTRALAKALHRPTLPIPGWITAPLLRTALGSLAEEMLLGGAFAYPKRLMAAGFPFRYSSLETALASLYSPLRFN